DAADPDAVRTVPVDAGDDVLPVAGDWNGRDLVTLDDLRQIFGSVADEPTVAEGLPALNAVMVRAGISTPARKAAFLATLRSESGFRYDAVERGNDSRYRGRGLIQLTGEHNYRAAGEFLDLDLVGDPDRATDGLVSPVVAAWYWTVARDINTAADHLDMAAVNIAVGFEPSERRDMVRCGDFLAALRYYSGEEVPEDVNCERTARSRLLAFAATVPFVPSGVGGGAPSGDVSLPDPPEPVDPGVAAPTSTARATLSAPPRPPATTPPTTVPATRPPTSAPMSSAPPSTAPSSTGASSSSTRVSAPAVDPDASTTSSLRGA
ncbi:MAG: hypothetical protein JXA83_04775, partial [Acidimicrobiales bacterium]|nr:hypothetical protein [Acidimicrobiales bacterium]